MRGEADGRRTHDSVYYAGVLSEYGLLIVLLAVFYWSGASARLAEGIRRVLGHRWPLVHAAYLGIVLLGAAAALCPIHIWRALSLDRWAEEEGTEQRCSGWLQIYVQSLAAQGLYAFAFFYSIHILLRFWPHGWWVVAGAVYAWFTLVFPAMLRRSILPRMYATRDVTNTAVGHEIRDLASKAGFRVGQVAVWTAERLPRELATWVSRIRRVCVVRPDLAAGRRPVNGWVAVAHELADVRGGRRIVRLALAVAGLMLCFAGVHHAALWLSRQGLRPPPGGLRDISAFPLLAFLILAGSGAAQVFHRTLERWDVFKKDRMASEWLGADRLVRALEEMARGRGPGPLWVEWLFFEEPCPHHRLRRLQEISVRKDVLSGFGGRR